VCGMPEMTQYDTKRGELQERLIMLVLQGTDRVFYLLARNSKLRILREIQNYGYCGKFEITCREGNSKLPVAREIPNYVSRGKFKFEFLF